ncbi:MAG: hypothetical protein ABI183_02070 [Polyangiaceae bacterium]
MLLRDADWPQINALRAEIEKYTPASVEDAGQHFSSTFVGAFSSIVLARVFMVLPFEELPAREQSFARMLVSDDTRLGKRTPVLSLIGTSGREPSWNRRQSSNGHLAIPLLDKAFVGETPMIAKLLADLQLDLAPLDDGFAATTSKMLGSESGKFYVADAATAKDARDRFVIPSRAFVSKYDVHTVFGMGGSYYDGKLAVAIFFTNEIITRLVADRFASFISTFRTITTRLQQQKKIFAAA